MTVLGKRSQVSENTETETETNADSNANANTDAGADSSSGTEIEHKLTDGDRDSQQAEPTMRPIFSRRSNKWQQRRFSLDYAETREVEIGRISLFIPKLSARMRQAESSAKQRRFFEWTNTVIHVHA
ncbi:hypothetical protein DFQ27_001039 [Actinomortierella ambigua]|uniref:Uncharacterized protein n=1 Tax=Actinomortierella ambigua TaxID=1343610 RepID=A0A9P6U903_9FUNG|nr:hypothetical protein DFQ27_001039 [Actinomortierella ambigua]